MGAAGLVSRRLIPARAGKTVRMRQMTVADSAHPRAGGENRIIAATVARSAGSSPRGRGKPLSVCPCRAYQRLIPARAGKTSERDAVHKLSAAHPRAGGENAEPKRDPLGVAGSSPRGRGKPRKRGAGQDGRRLIPARAGKTHAGRGWHDYRQAHPRAGGENPGGHQDDAAPPGSSPRGRGKRHP